MSDIKIKIEESLPIVIKVLAKGDPGPAGVGVPTGGTAGQVLGKTSDDDYDTHWVDQGGGAVDSVNGKTGVVVLDTDDITDTATNRFTNDTDIARLANTSGTNTGDQDLSGYALSSSLATVATTGDYDDLIDKPTIPSISGLVPYTGATADVDLGANYLKTEDRIAVGSSAATTGILGQGINVNQSMTMNTNGTATLFEVSSAISTSANNGSVTILNAAATLTPSNNTSNFTGLNFAPTVVPNGVTTANVTALSTAPFINGFIGNPGGSVSNLNLIVANSNNFAATVSSTNAINVSVNNTAGTNSTVVGLNMLTLQGTNVKALNIGNFNSTHTGSISIGTSTVAGTSELLNLVSTTKALVVSRMTTTQKNALTAVDGMILYDSTQTKFAFRESGSWVNKANLVGADDIEITNTAKGVVLTAPNASRWRITVDNSGNLTTTSI